MIFKSYKLMHGGSGCVTGKLGAKSQHFWRLGVGDGTCDNAGGKDLSVYAWKLEEDRCMGARGGRPVVLVWVAWSRGCVVVKGRVSRLLLG